MPVRVPPDAKHAAPLAASEGPRSVVNLPRDLSPWSMFLSADVLVQAVMLGLAFASVVTWTVWLAKIIEFRRAIRRLRLQTLNLAQRGSLTELSQHLTPGRGVMQAFVRAAEAELGLSSDLADKTGIKERIATRLQRLETAAARNMHKGTGLLATVGATAPFVGLFGSAWGIMNSFIGISKAQTTNLAVVAPGIAEALLARDYLQLLCPLDRELQGTRWGYLRRCDPPRIPRSRPPRRCFRECYAARQVSEKR